MKRQLQGQVVKAVRGSGSIFSVARCGQLWASSFWWRLEVTLLDQRFSKGQKELVGQLCLQPRAGPCADGDSCRVER